MICPDCGGKGGDTYDVFGWTKCRTCNGTGKVEQTNEEWFCGLSTEENAETLSNVIRKAWIGYVSRERNVDSWEFWEKWLKEVHKE